MKRVIFENDEGGVGARDSARFNVVVFGNA